MPVYNPTPATQQEYIEACRIRKAHIEGLREEWKDAVERCNELRIAIPKLKAAWQKAREVPAPISPYNQLVLAGMPVNPELFDE